MANSGDCSNARTQTSADPAVVVRNKQRLIGPWFYMGGQRPLVWIPAHARQLAAAGVLTGKSWSLAQVCEHLALAFDTTTRGSAAEPIPQRWKALRTGTKVGRCFAKHVMLVSGWFPSGVSAPASVTPTDEPALEPALNRLQQSAEAFERKCTLPGATWSYHSILGKMNGRLWRRFHTIHAAHHFSFFQIQQKN